ncbi:MAG: hypothetical protein J7578_20195, partial [Chitinophagaceae bacterium]|nr:hypothetical protein [Chitinophagaceae bacterium]
DPAFNIDIIEKGSWGNTVEEAAGKYVIQTAEGSNELRIVCALLEKCIPAALPVAVASLINSINNLAATSDDVVQLMEVIPPLVSVTRYGNVRNTDAKMVMQIVDSMITRICISLPATCVSVDEDAAEHLLELFRKMTEAVNLLQDPALTKQWQQTLDLISGSSSTAPVIAGYATRLLSDFKLFQGDELLNRFYRSMSVSLPPATAAAWLEGFLKGSGTILLLDNALWSVVNNWLEHLPDEVFMQVLPLLRRTFAHFSQPERKKLGEKAKHGDTGIKAKRTANGIDTSRAVQGIPIVMKLFNYPIQTQG